MSVLGAIDIGTNSVHLVVARASETDRFEVVTRRKEMVRLGSGGGDLKRISPAAMDRGIEALVRCRQVADAAGATFLRAVATSAVREANNGYRFIHRARHEAAVEIEVVSGLEEARLIHLGVLQAVPVFDQRLLLIDIGGGSTELLVGERGATVTARSLKLGAIRLTDRYFSTKRLRPGQLKECRRGVRAALAPFAREIERHGFEVAVGSSGTIQNVALMAVLARGEEAPRTLNALEVARDEVDAVVERLADAGTVAARKSVEGLDPERADIILAGAVILEQVMGVLDVESLLISENALREGVLLDTLARFRGASLHHLHDLRRQSVTHLAELMDEDSEHSAQTARLALRLFDETRDRHRLGDAERELLEAAALLANVGLFVSHDKHHKHSYYVIRNSEHLTGFTDAEIELIAQVARYHRKSPPKPKHTEFAALSEHDQRIVRVLAGILRVAIALDRSHAGLVRDVEVDGDDEGVVVDVLPEPGADVSLELYVADERKGLAEEALGATIRLRSPA